MNEKYFIVGCLIDRSGSMSSIKNDTIGGFNSFLEEQKKASVKIDFSLSLFDTVVDKLYSMENINNVKSLSREDYIVGGCTALNDAIGETVSEIGAKIREMNEKDRPSKVIIAILTDGEENSSKEYSHKQIADMIKEQQDKYSWEFIYLAANQDAFKIGETYNFKGINTNNFIATPSGIHDAYSCLSRSVSSYISND